MTLNLSKLVELVVKVVLEQFIKRKGYTNAK